MTFEQYAESNMPERFRQIQHRSTPSIIRPGGLRIPSLSAFQRANQACVERIRAEQETVHNNTLLLLKNAAQANRKEKERIRAQIVRDEEELASLKPYSDNNDNIREKGYYKAGLTLSILLFVGILIGCIIVPHIITDTLIYIPLLLILFFLVLPLISRSNIKKKNRAIRMRVAELTEEISDLNARLR